MVLITSLTTPGTLNPTASGSISTAITLSPISLALSIAGSCRMLAPRIIIFLLITNSPNTGSDIFHILNAMALIAVDCQHVFFGVFCHPTNSSLFIIQWPDNRTEDAH